MSNDQNKQISPEHIYYIFGELFPSEFEFLVLYNLSVNYPSAEMQYAEIKQAIADTSRLPFINTGRNPQIERTFKGLLRCFFERSPSRVNRFILTPHAEKLVEIAIHRINNPYLKFPLKETFEEYFSLPANVEDDIKILQSWFKFGFQNNARQVVIGHIDGLKLAVDDAIKALNQVLEADNLSVMQMLEQFSKNFQTLGDKARQITEAIRMKIEVHYRLRDVVDAFANKVSEQLGDIADNTSLQNSRRIAFEIRDEVYVFFERVDKQLDVINMKMAFASTKIAELQETLRTQSQYKISLKKLLVYLLENSKRDTAKWIVLPEKFPAKGLVMEKFRFRGIRYYDLGFLKRTKPLKQTADPDYEEAQRLLFEHELRKQALIQENCGRLEDELASAKQIPLDVRLFEIMKHDDGVEISIQTGYEFIRNLSPGDDINIDEKLKSDVTNSIHLWKTTIHHSQDSIS
jgi:hypothetical protein